MQVTFFQDQKAQTLIRDNITLEKLRSLVLGTSAASKAELPWLKLAIFGDKTSTAKCLRHDGNVLKITGIELDYDAKKVSLKEAIKIAKRNKLQCMIYTSPSYTKAAPKWRLLVPTSEPLAPEARKPLADHVNKMFGGIFARESLILSQAYYFGYVGKNRNGHCAEIVDGEYVNLNNEFVRFSEGVKQPVDVDELLERMAPGNIHATHLSVVGSLVNAGIAVEEIVKRVLEATRAVVTARWNWKKEERDLTRMAESFYAKQEAEATVAVDVSSIGITYEDFVSYLPEHTYYFLPIRESWSAASVNSQLPPKKKMAASAWLDRNKQVHQMIWAPGFPTVIENKLVDGGTWIDRPKLRCLNLYRAPEIELGNSRDAERWIELLNLLYPNDAQHITRYFAQRVQQPATKINHGLLLGGAPGIGKDTLLEGLKHAVGPWNFVDIAPTHLLGSFNGFIKSVVLRISEARDFGDINRYSFYEHTKTLLCAPPDTLRCNEKFTHEHTVFNVTGVIFTTNHKTSGLYIPEDDRRHYVAWSDRGREEFSDDYWREFWGWYYTGGLEAIAAYLMEYKLDGFDPKAPPVRTKAFWEMVDANRSPEESEAADAIDKLGNPPVVTLEMLVAAADYEFASWLNERKNRRAIPHRLEKIGYVTVANPDNIQRVWSVFDAKTKQSKRQIVYARKDLSVAEQISAARKLCSRA